MSIDVMVEVWKYAPVKGGDLLLLLCLADHANHLGICWPSVPKLAERSRLNERQVYRIINNLERKGLIEIDRGAGSRKGNCYRVNVSNFNRGDIFTGGDIYAEEGDICDN